MFLQRVDAPAVENVDKEELEAGTPPVRPSLAMAPSSDDFDKP